MSVTQQDLDDYKVEIEGQAFVATEIDDSITSTGGTWSSSKIAAEILARSGIPAAAFAVSMAKVNPNHVPGQTIGYFEGYFGGNLLRVEAATPWTDNADRPTVWSVKVNGVEYAVVDENTLPAGSLLAPLANRMVGGSYRLTLSDLALDRFVLDANSTGSTVVLMAGVPHTFEDSGQRSNYSSNEAYTVTFDTRGSGASFLFNSFTFEHTESSMYDRLGVAVSENGTSWSAPNIPWMQRSAASMYPWTSGYGGNASWNGTNAGNGYIVPKNEPRAILLGWDEGAFTLPQRYIRWSFYSDGSVTMAGWNCTITRL